MPPALTRQTLRAQVDRAEMMLIEAKARAAALSVGKRPQKARVSVVSPEKCRRINRQANAGDTFAHVCSAAFTGSYPG